MTSRSAGDLGPVEAGGVSIEGAVREVRLQAGRLGRAQKALQQLLSAFTLPSEDELREMREGARPVSREVHLFGALQTAVDEVETCKVNLRLAVQKWVLDDLDKDWKPGLRPDRMELQFIEEAEAMLRNAAGGPSR